MDQLGPEFPTALVFSQSPPKYPLLTIDGKVNQPAWRERTPLNLASPLHDLPKHLERVLPKFDPRNGVFVEDHLNFLLSRFESFKC